MTKSKSWNTELVKRGKAFYPYSLSADTKSIVTSSLNRASLNLGLFFSKFIISNDGRKIDPKTQLESLFSNNGPKNENKNKKKDKKGHLVAITWGHIPKIYSSFFKRRKYLLQTLSQMGYEVKELTLTLDWRLLVNLGMASVYETSLLLHRNYSIPYIPGTAVKGIIRHYVDTFLKSKVSEQTIEEIFGNNKQKGSLIFFDALPVVKKNPYFPLIVADVMNVHYPDYYKDARPSPPGDWMNPNPIFFLAVEKGNSFSFAFARPARPKEGTETQQNEDGHDKQNENPLDLIEKWLKQATKWTGIGAKTSSGYGFFH